MLYTSLNIRIYVTDFDAASYRLESTMPLFLSDTLVPLFAFKGAARGGAEGAQAPPLAIRILIFIS